jgi:hypothetical protein
MNEKQNCFLCFFFFILFKINFFYGFFFELISKIFKHMLGINQIKKKDYYIIKKQQMISKKILFKLICFKLN